MHTALDLDLDLEDLGITQLRKVLADRFKDDLLIIVREVLRCLRPLLLVRVGIMNARLRQLRRLLEIGIGIGIMEGWVPGIMGGLSMIGLVRL